MQHQQSEYSPGSSAATSPVGGVVFQVVAALLAGWRWLVGVPLAITLLALVIVLRLHSTFEAATSFVTEGRSSSMSTLASLGSSFGINLPASDPSQSPDFYADLLKATPIVRAVLLTRYDTSAGAEPGDRNAQLLDYLKPGRGDSRLRLFEAAKALVSMTTVSVDHVTNIVRIQVRAAHPRLAAEIANQYTAELMRFNLDKRQTKAHLRRVFAEAEAAEAGRALAAAEDTLRDFRERNRARGSPSLQDEEQRLLRHVAARQDLYNTLNREFELSRIAEADDTPLISVIEPAIPPVKKAGPYRTRIMLLTIIGSFIITTSLTVFLSLYGRETSALWRSVRASLLEARTAR